MAARIMAEERRRAPRAAERVPLAITGTEATVQAETKNLSAAGAYFTLDRFIAPMTKLQLQMELPSGTGDASRGKTIRCAGVVVRVDPLVAHAERGGYHIAVFFTELSDRDRSAIARFVSQRLSADRSSS